MNQEADYASDSDQSDVDFCPDKEAGISDALSEEASDDEVSDDDQIKANKRSKTKILKHVPRIKKTAKRSKKVSEQNSAESEDEDEPLKNRRSTRQVDDSNANSKGSNEKDELESDEEDKSRTDALWADFLNDVKPAGSKSTTEAVPSKCTNGTTPKVSEKPKPVETVPKKITVTEIVDFAGEEVRVEKVVNADSIKENKAKPIGVSMPSSSPRGFAPGFKRPAASGSGLGSILNQIGKKKKISVLEKTHLDWKSFKQNEGIEEELQTHNKGKDGYLERQDFLQRTDVRQFEIEKNLRQTKR